MTRNPWSSVARRLIAAASSVAIITLFAVVAPRAASAQSAPDENAMFNATNQSRADAGLPPLQYDPALSQIANAWSNQMASSATLQHNPDLVNQVNNQVTTQWTRLGENVGYGPDVATLEQAFMNSAPHRANILGDYNRVGIGATRDANGTLWVTIDFLKGPPLPSYQPPGTVQLANWYLRATPTQGSVDAAFAYGVAGYQFVSGDWNDDGMDTAGVYVGGNWYLRNSFTGGTPDVSFAYGDAGYVPVVGDWNGDGKATIGVYLNGWWYLRNSNTPGAPDIVIHYGAPGNTPVVGDWNGDGKDTIGVYAGGYWYLRNSNTGGAPDVSFAYGAPGYAPVVGSWNGGTADGIGVYVNGWWYLRNTASPGAPNATVDYGAPGYAPVTGRWSKGGPTGIGVIVAG